LKACLRPLLSSFVVLKAFSRPPRPLSEPACLWYYSLKAPILYKFPGVPFKSFKKMEEKCMGPFRRGSYMVPSSSLLSCLKKGKV